MVCPCRLIEPYVYCKLLRGSMGVRGRPMCLKALMNVLPSGLSSLITLPGPDCTLTSLVSAITQQVSSHRWAVPYYASRIHSVKRTASVWCRPLCPSACPFLTKQQQTSRVGSVRVPRTFGSFCPRTEFATPSLTSNNETNR